MSRHHVLDSSPETIHWGVFDPGLRPVLTVRSGDTVTVNTVSGGKDAMPPPPHVVPPELR
jgi:acetamidase/formamidase